MEDINQDNFLRPRFLAEFQGQEALKANLEVFIEAAKRRKEALDHLFISGPPGLGKTTLAGIVASELGVNFVLTSAPALEKPKDLAGLLTSLQEGSLFFIDEIHRLRPAIEEMLYIAMEDFEMDLIVGQGVGARSVRVPLPRFTLVGATTKPGSVSAPLHTRFGITIRINPYTQLELQDIIDRSARLLNIAIDPAAASLLAQSSRGTPRVANRLLKRVRDFAQVHHEATINLPISELALSRLQVDHLGLEDQDRTILRTLIEVYKGGPVGLQTLAIAVGESAESLEDFYEPYLVQQGLIMRTRQGRLATDLAYQHLNIPRPNAPRDLFE
ncbi:Holliday junction branch migration DNA helicase RuvB [Entomospira culicis]|uniref:Holliday junction branch migration complex subunit RuvB n=1 Tax=Entomospira culicis TaxID=2719989 RepID=A0A968KV30_9SPIO|nr:Holliday junction branch migration DNA helicase RuvB [Entomospira culicis]NIZ19355.1 Holliday junction branch migration DNA helicase RuvB [Entomospira culicis]NIZ69740.1 Holliday junction branch migration DNA helicase RuvB [Entomospira culicis]WDI37969.1 Holliday junction branch migration DNA helicase RuvB [Entomospira culicis]WDI39592.1 Holliday junction branch migration DNA helicase RuvB [Entomospira culicis]